MERILNRLRPLAICVVLAALAACSETQAPESSTESSTGFGAPMQDVNPARRYIAANEVTRRLTGAAEFVQAVRMPDANDAPGTAGQETLRVTGESGYILDAELDSVASPAVQVQNDTLRALMELPVEASQTLVYRVVEETKARGGEGMCEGADVGYLVMWEGDDPAAAIIKVLGVAGAAPGENNSRACALLDYRRP